MMMDKKLFLRIYIIFELLTSILNESLVNSKDMDTSIESFIFDFTYYIKSIRYNAYNDDIGFQLQVFYYRE